MTASVILLVLSAAFLHAIWNAVVKGSSDKAVALALITGGHVLIALVFLPFVPLPAAAALPFLAASTLIHWVYYYLIDVSYRHGDLSLAYPIARGLAPVMVALGALIWADERLALSVWLGIVIVSAGILFLAMQKKANKTAVKAAMLNSVIIAAYSIVDGIGIRVSQAPLGYVVWLFILEGSVVIYVLLSRWERARMLSVKAISVGVCGGMISGFAYGMALYAKTLAPLGVVSALRETSVVFAALIGIWWFNEGPRGRRFCAACIVTVGIVMISVM